MNSGGQIPNVSYYGVETMSGKKCAEFLALYESQSSEVFDNRSVLEAFSQDDVTVLRQACRVFRHLFIVIGNVDVFLKLLQLLRLVIKCCEIGF